MKQLLLFPFVTLLLLISCKKDSEAPISIRVKNVSGNTFSYSNAYGKEFGVIANGITTTYQQFDKVVAYAGAQIAIGTDTTYAGVLYCGTPPLPMLTNGKYILEIFEDNSTAPAFLNARFIKE